MNFAALASAHDFMRTRQSAIAVLTHRQHGVAHLHYKGHGIQVALYPDHNGETFHATYKIIRGLGDIVTGTIAGGVRTVAEAEHEAYLAACRWIDEQDPSVENKETLEALNRTVNGSSAELLLTKVRIAHSLLDLATTTPDGKRREHNIQTAVETLRRMDTYITRIDSDSDQQAKTLLTARNALSQRLREIGRRFPNDK